MSTLKVNAGKPWKTGAGMKGLYWSIAEENVFTLKMHKILNWDSSFRNSFHTKINHKNKIFPINTPSMCKTDPSVKSTWKRAAQGVRLRLAPRLLELCPAVYAAPGSLGIGFTASLQLTHPTTAHSQGLFGACFQSPISSVLWVL